MSSVVLEATSILSASDINSVTKTNSETNSKTDIVATDVLFELRLEYTYSWNSPLI